MKLPAAFGALPTGADLTRVQASPNYRNGSFQNLEDTPVLLPGASYPRMLLDYLRQPATVQPPKPLPSQRFRQAELVPYTSAFVWFGHSSYYLQVGGKSILVDPVFSGSASPFSFFGKAFSGAVATTVADFHSLDLLLLTHDHYDHLDYPTLRDIHPIVRQFVVPLGVAAHLKRWGVPSHKITELDWWQTHQLDTDVQLTATPARHFSGRGVRRGQSLWCSYVLQADGFRLFLGGDSGYDGSFAKIGQQLGPFDLAFLECGQYGANWPYIHMTPEQTVQAANDLNAKVLVPVHWGKFVLSHHDWDEPIQRVVAEAKRLNQAIATPPIGTVVPLRGPYPVAGWWANL